MTDSTGDLAPIGVSTYARIDHLRRCIEALQANPPALKSTLFIFSDGPRAGDEEKVGRIREFARAIEGFREVVVVERQTNDRVFNNREGMSRLLHDFGRLIWVEEDIVAAPGFLQFMNAALDRYAEDPQVLSISGYTPPIPVPDDYAYDAFVLPRFCAWGFATWAGRFDPVRISFSREQYRDLVRSPGKMYRITRAGWDILSKLRAEGQGAIDALDVKLFYHQFVSGTATVYPAKSLTLNEGHDGTGIHCDRSDRFDTALDVAIRSTFSFPPEPEPDPRIMREHFRFRSGPPLRRWATMLGLLLKAYKTDD